MEKAEWIKTEEYPINDRVARIFQGTFPWSYIKELQKKLSKMEDIQKCDSGSIEKINASIGKINIQELKKVFDEARNEHRKRLDSLQRKTYNLNRAAGEAIKDLSRQITEVLDQVILFVREYNLKMGNVDIDIQHLNDKIATTDDIIITIEQRVNELLIGKIKIEDLINNINQEIVMLEPLKNEVKELKSELSTVTIRLGEAEKDIVIIKELVNAKADIKSIEELKSFGEKNREEIDKFKGYIAQIKLELNDIKEYIAGVANPRLVGAQEAFDKGKIEIVTSLLRPALEDHLRQLCIKLGCLPKGETCISNLNEALYKIGYYDNTMYIQLKTMANIGNKGSHALVSSRDKVQALLLLIKDFIKQHPL